MEITISVQLTLKDQWFFSVSSQASWCYLQEFCCGLINRVTWSQTDRSLPILLLLSATCSPNSVKSPWKPLRNVLAYFQKNIKHILKKKREKKEKKYFKKSIGWWNKSHCKKSHWQLTENSQGLFLCPGSVSLGHIPLESAYVCGCSLLSLLFCLNREIVSKFHFLVCLKDS